MLWLVSCPSSMFSGIFIRRALHALRCVHIYTYVYMYMNIILIDLYGLVTIQRVIHNLLIFIPCSRATGHLVQCKCTSSTTRIIIFLFLLPPFCFLSRYIIPALRGYLYICILMYRSFCASLDPFYRSFSLRILLTATPLSTLMPFHTNYRSPSYYSVGCSLARLRADAEGWTSYLICTHSRTHRIRFSISSPGD